MLLDPNGSLLQFWDLLTLYALTYTVFITPYEIGFLTSATQPITLDLMNYFITCIFGIGIILNFFTPFRASRIARSGSNPALTPCLSLILCSNPRVDRCDLCGIKHG